MNCAIQLNRYQIESVSVSPNDQFVPDLKSLTGDIATTISISPHKDDKRRFRLALHVKIQRSPGKEARFFPYEIDIKGRGYFTFEREYSPNDMEHVLRLNGASILYGLMRGQIAQITAQSVHGQFLLPTLNFVEMEAQSSCAEARMPNRASKPSATEKISAQKTSRRPLKKKK